MKNKKLHRVIATMNREEIDYLDKIGKDSLFTTGVKLSRIKILRAMVEAMKKLGIDGKNIKNEEGLRNEILKKVPRAFLITILILGILIMPFTPAYSKANRVSKTVTLTLKVVPRSELNINTAGIDKKLIGFDSEDRKDLTVNKTYRDGEEVIVITTVPE